MSFGKGDFGGSIYYGSAGQTSGTTNAFNRLSQGIANNIYKITQNVKEIKKYISSLGTHEDTKHLRAKLDEVQHYTNQLAKDTSRMLKDLSAIKPANPSDQKQQRMQKDRLANEFTAALNQFQEVQHEAANKERQSVDKARTGSTISAGFEDQSSDTLIGFDSPGQAPVMSQQSQPEFEDFEAIREREAQLKKLESDIVDVNQIFKDLSTMVLDQGDMLDSIEKNVESAEIYVENANTQLDKASKFQSRSRRKTCLVIICLVILLIVVGLVIYFIVT